MNEMIILNHNEEYLDIILVNECIECSRDRKINGYNTLDFSLHVSHQISSQIVKNNRIIFNVDEEDRWYEYIIASIVKNNGIVSVHCESSLYSTLSNYIEFVDITGNTVLNGLTKILNSCTPESDWNIGRSDISGSFYMQRSKKHLKEVLLSWAEEVGGQIDERIEFYNGKITRYIDIVQKLGTDHGKVLYDDREISECSIKEPDGYVYTCAYGYGASTGLDENGNAIFTTFEDIEWNKANGDPVNKPQGQKYISLELNDNQLQLYGLKVNGKFKHRTTVVEFNDVSDSRNLLRRTYQSLIDNIADKTEYTINSKDMKKLGYDVEEVRLGDTIGIVIEKLGKIKLRADVIRYKEDYKNPSNNIFELNNYSSNYVSQQLNYQQAVSEIQNKVQGIIHQTFFKTVLERWNEEINSEGSYLVQGDPLDGLVAYNAETKAKATKATRLKGGSLQISNRKVNGEFEWTTVLTGDGMIADVIIAGILKGNMFDIDLDSGIVRFGKRDSSGNITDPLLLLDEDGLKIKHITQIENDVSKLMKNFNVYLETNCSASQIYDSNALTYIPDFFANNLVITAHAYDLEENELSDARYEWKRKTENGLEPLVAGEHVNNNILTISHNFDESVTFVCTATLDLISKKEEITVISTKTGKDGQDGQIGPVGPQGPQGIQGPQGVQGPKGENGKQYYTWLKYADSPTSGMTDNPTGKAYIGLAYNKETSTESNNYSDYLWSLIKGPKGDQGVAGGKGADGTTFYTWIKYATSSSGANMSDDPTGKSYIGLAYNKTTPTESTNAADYTWSLIKGDKGDKGDAGKGIKSTAITYQAGTSGTTAPTGTWTVSIPTVAQGQYLWSKTVITYTDNTTSTTYSVAYIPKNGTNGTNGATGATGTGVNTIVQQYYLSTSKTAQSGGSWVTAMPVWSVGKYLWTRFQINYKNPASTVYTTPVCDSSWEAVNEIQVGAKNLLLNSDEVVTNASYPIKQYKMSEKMVANETYTCRLWGTLGAGKSYFGLWLDGGSISLGSLVNKGNGIFELTFKGKAGTLEQSVINVYPVASSVSVNSTITKIKLEKGNKATDWTPAPEDINEKFDEAANDLATQLSNAKAEFSSDIVKTADTIKQEVSASYYSKDDGELLAQRAAKLEQDSESWTFNFETLTKQLAGLDKEQKENYARILKYIRFENGNIILGESGNALTLTIQNDKIVFKQSDKELAYFTNGKLYVTNGEFTQNLRIGQFAFVPRSNGSLDFKKVG